MSDTALAYAVQNLDLQRLQNEQLTLYNTYNSMLTSGSHAQLCSKALEVIKAREKTNRKIDLMNCDATCLAVCLIFPLFCLPAMLKDHDYDADAIATGLHAEHVPESYKRCGAIPESRRPNSIFKSSGAAEIASSAMAQKRPSISHTESSHEQNSIFQGSDPAEVALSAVAQQRLSLSSYTDSSHKQTLTTASPFAVLDNVLERAFSGIPKASTTAPVANLLKIDDISDTHVIEEIEYGLLSGSVAIVLSPAVVDRRLPELLLAETGRKVCWDVFRTEARRFPEEDANSCIALRLIGDGKLVFFTNNSMTVLGGFLSGGVFVLGTFRAVAHGEQERDFILNCYRRGILCRVYYMKAPRGALKVREFFREVLGIGITPLKPGELYDLHGVGQTDTRMEK